MKSLLIILIQVLPIDSSVVCGDTWGSSLNDCYFQYFNTKPAQRGNYIIKLINSRQLVDAHYISNIVNDLGSLAGKTISYDYDIGSFYGEFILKDTVEFRREISIAQKEIIESHSMLNCENENFKTLLKTGTLEKYVKMCLKMRISFLERFHKRMSLSTVQIIQKDLDTLLNIKTKRVKRNTQNEIKQLAIIYISAFQKQKKYN